MFSNQEKDSKKKTGAKTGVDVKGASKRRENQAIGIRTNKRGETMTKRRNLDADENDAIATPGSALSAATTGNPQDPMSYDSKTNPSLVPLSLLPNFAEMCRSPDQAFQMQGTLMIRKLLSIEENPPITEIVDTGIVPVLIEHLKRDDFPQLQFEAAWAVTNVASGTQQQTHYVMEQNAVPHFIRILNSPSEDVREQATWALGNMAGDSAKCRDYILDQGCLPELLRCIALPCEKISVLRNAVWTLSNLCRSKPPPALEKVQDALPVLASLLNHGDNEIVADACWAISFISDGPAERVQATLQQGVIPRIVQLLSSPATTMQTPAIRTVGNVVTGTDAQTQVIVSSGALAAFPLLLTSSKRAIKKEACWALSNITAGNVDQVQAVIHANLVPMLMQCMHASELEVVKEAVWCMANTTSGGTVEQTKYLISEKVLDALTYTIGLYDVKIVGVALEAMENILLLGSEIKKEQSLARNPFADVLQDNGGLDKIEALQNHSNREVYEQAMDLLEKYFETEDDGDAGVGGGNNAEPEVTAQASGFAFGAGAVAGGNITF